MEVVGRRKELVYFDGKLRGILAGIIALHSTAKKGSFLLRLFKIQQEVKIDSFRKRQKRKEEELVRFL